jgi:hypothetical protein
VLVGSTLSIFKNEVKLSRFGTQGNEHLYGMLRIDMHDENTKDRLNLAIKHYISKQWLTNVKGRNLNKPITCEPYDMPTEDVESFLDILLRRTVMILEFVGLPIDQKLKHYYEAGKVEAPPINFALKEIFYFIDDELLDNLEIDYDRNLTSKVFSNKSARSAARRCI